MQASDRKLAELMLYVARKCESDEHFGMTKINEILFFADFGAYAKSGVSVTGQAYQKQDHGPCPRRLLPVQNELESDGSCAIEHRNVFGYKQKRLVALREPDLRQFTGEEIAIVDDAIDRLKDHSAKATSELSHRFPGWKLAAAGEEIPYETVFLGDRELSESEKAIARALSASRT